MSASARFVPVLDVNSTALLPGSMWGQRCVTSPACLSSVVRGWGTPPAEETSDKDDVLSLVNTIVSPSPHAPPRSSAASQSVTAAPPCTEIFFSFPSAKKPIHWPSGEKKGSRASSVPESAVACGWLSARTYRRWWYPWSVPLATRANRVLSG